MAVVNNGTVNGLPADRLPVGYTAPVVTTVPDFHYRYDTTVVLSWATTITSATPSTNMTAIVSATTSAVTAIITADFISSANILAYSIINGLENTNDAKIPTNLSSGVPQSLNVSVTIFVKAT